MKAVHIARYGETDQEPTGAVVVGPQVWADSFRDNSGSKPGGDPVEEAFARLGRLLDRSGSGLDLIAKIDAYVDSNDRASCLREFYAREFPAPRPVLQIQIAEVWGPDPVLLDVVAAVRQ